MKKVLTILLVFTTIGAGVFSFLKVKEIERLKTEIEYAESEKKDAVTKIDELNEKVKGLSETTKVYATTDNAIQSGTKLEMRYLKEIEVPNSAAIVEQCLNSETIYDYIGMEFKTFTEPGSILFKSMFRPAERYDQEIYELTLAPPSIPVGLKEGDMITVFMSIPGIPRIPIFAKEEVKHIVKDSIILNVSNEDLRIWDQVFEDCAIYGDVGVKWIVSKYVDDNDDIVAYYPVSEDYRNIINFDPNIKDKSRLLNKGVREYIEYIFYKLKHVGSKEEADAIKDSNNVIVPDPFTNNYNIYDNNMDAAVKDARDEVNKNGLKTTKETTATEETTDGGQIGGLFD